MVTEITGRRRKYLSSPYVVAILLFALAFAIRMFGIGDAPLRTDEIYHLLAGRSWADHGTLALGDGIYTRAKYYSIATGWFFELFGPTPGVGRSLAAVAGALLVGGLALWIARIADLSAALVAALLLCFNYTSITISQFARFYTWHALAMFVLAVTVYAAATSIGTVRVSRLALLVVVALLTLLSGIHLQPTTVMMAIALTVWIGLYLLLSGKLDFIVRSPLPVTVAAIAIAAVATLVVVLEHKILADSWWDFRRASEWSMKNRSDVVFYIDVLTHLLGWLFTLFPLAILIAWRKYRQPASFCLVIVAVSLGLHSIAGMKAVRYVFYVFPFIFAAWGFAFSAVAAPIWRYLSDILPSGLGRLRPIMLAGIILLITGFAFVGMTDFRLTATAAARAIKTGSPAQPFEYGAAREEVNWAPYLSTLRSLKNSGLFMATDSVRTIYYLGDYDLLLNKTELSDVGPLEFMLDKRTGKRDISTGRSVEQIVRCYPSGALIVSDPRWRSVNVTDEAADVVEQWMKPVPLPSDLHMRAFRWNHAPDSSPSACAKIYAMIGKPRP